MLQTTSDIPTA